MEIDLVYMLSQLPVTTVIDYLGVVIGVVAGTLYAIDRQMDTLGAASLGIVTGFGGGIIRDLLLGVAHRLDLRVMEGIYAFTSGPVYETPAEIHAYGHMGADIVGMSTVPEAVFAKACGMRVAGLSLVSNHAAGISAKPLAHDEVIAASAAAKPAMADLLDGFIRSL